MAQVQVSEAVARLCDEFEIEIISNVAYPKVGQTRATKTLERLLRKHGEAHMRLVLSTLVEAGPNGALLDENTLCVTSDLVQICETWIESDPSSWFDAWDQIPVGEIIWLMRDLRAFRPMPRMILGAFYLALQNFRGGHDLNRAIRDGMDRKLFDLMNRQGTGTGYARETSAMLGRTIMAAEKLMPAAEFGGWLTNECGLSIQQAKRFVKQARQEGEGEKAAA